MSEVRVVRQRSATGRSTATGAIRPTAPVLTARQFGRPGAPLRLLGIGASTGGPNAVVQVLSDLGPAFSLPILVVQHIIPSFLDGFATWLQGVTPFQVVIARPGDRPAAGTVYMAPADHHLQMEGDRIRLTQDPPVSVQRPSATVMFQSMARSLGASGLGILLTGMGDDGADGLLALRKSGGYTIAEHESTAVVYGMPKAAVDRGAACECLPLTEIAPRVRELMTVGQEA